MSAVPTKSQVLVLSNFYVPAYKGGGPIQTLKALVASAPDDFDVSVICANNDLNEKNPLVERPNEWLDVNTGKALYVQGGLKQLVNTLKSVEPQKIMYLNSLFNTRYSVLPLVMYKLGFIKAETVLLAPRGELSPGALALKSRKKQLFLGLYRALGLANKVVWHASTAEEVLHIKNVFGEKAHTVVRMNETSLPKVAKKRTSRTPGAARLLFVSRLDEKKGLHTLLEAMANVTNEVELNIVGAFGDNTYEARCRELVKKLPHNVQLRFSGALPRERVFQAIQEADLMVFPTAGENFGHVIAEALSEGCPVMCSEHTPWTETLRSGGGVAVSPNEAQNWSVAIDKFVGGAQENWTIVSNRAAAAYDAWQQTNATDHVFTMVLNRR